MLDANGKVYFYLLFEATTLIDIIGNGKTFAPRDYAHIYFLTIRSENTKKKVRYLIRAKSSRG
jgi:hypothetical protein